MPPAEEGASAHRCSRGRQAWRSDLDGDDGRTIRQAVYEAEVSLLQAALRSFKKTSVVSPFPKHFVEGEAREKNYTRLQLALDDLPSAAELFGEDGAASADAEDVSELLHFLRTHSNLVPVEQAEAQRLYTAAAGTQYTPQFAFEVRREDARAREFEAEAVLYRPEVAYHGSPMGNWYSIAKNGLRNFTGLRAPTHGSLFGEGIYLARSLRLASDFSASSCGWEKSEVLVWYSLLVL